MKKSKTAIIGIWLCILAIASEVLKVITNWPRELPPESEATVVLMYLSYFPMIAFLILRIVVFAKNKIKVLFPIVCIFEIVFFLRPLIQLLSVNGMDAVDFLSKITYVAFGTIPTIMLLVMAIRIERKTPTLFYLPAAIYFVLGIANMATEMHRVQFSVFNLIPIILWTAITFITGLFIREY
jgi:hypothetical protein